MGEKVIVKATNRLSIIQPDQVPVAHACNPSYLGGRDQEDHSSKPAPEYSS
jgi:hypothetical protein